MNRTAEIYNNEVLAGYLVLADDGYLFKYDQSYFDDKNTPSISMSFPKTSKEYRSKILFPFFYGLLAEGDQKYLQCRKLRIDENDNFTRLIKTAQNTIGAISVKEI
jgi:serine/threonine-protein kinase HipA